jgi:hypothetical protein
MNIVSDPKGGTWNPDILEQQLAPGITKFTKADISSIEEKHKESDYWVQNHFLNSVLTVGYKKAYRPTVIQALRRASAAFRYYHEARQSTIDYLAANNSKRPSSRKYFQLIDLWEAFFIQMQIFIDIYGKLSEFMGSNEKAFKKGDGSKEQRLYDISNSIKHVADSNRYEELKDRWMPLWLTDEGFKSYDINLSYAEACDCLDEVATFVNILQDPKTFAGNSSGAAV